MHAENAAARAAGYIDRTHTPEYKRMQRERDAEKQGRALCEYVPQAKKEERSALARVEKEADRIRARWAKEWLKPFQQPQATYAELCASDPTYKGRHAAKSRKSYWRRHQRELERIGIWKAAHPDQKRQYDVTRREREREFADGTVTSEEIAGLKQKATYCAYCACALVKKQTDHMVPLVLGGKHSLRNIVIVCPDCNARKARLSYEQWIGRVAHQHRARVVALFYERYGDLAVAA